MQEEDIYYKVGNKHAAQKIILLIDDDDDEHEIFSSALKNTKEGYHFISAQSCEKALNILKQLDPHYIFIDLNMPRTDGMICLQEIKKITRIAHVPVYMYSTGITLTDGQKAVRMGAVDYITKPNSVTTLSAVLRKILN